MIKPDEQEEKRPINEAIEFLENIESIPDSLKGSDSGALEYKFSLCTRFNESKIAELQDLFKSGDQIILKNDQGNTVKYYSGQIIEFNTEPEKIGSFNCQGKIIFKPTGFMIYNYTVLIQSVASFTSEK